MTMRTYEAIIDIPGRGSQRITVEGEDGFKAKVILEMRYGQGQVRAVRRLT
jgi:hypothetical protein